MISTLSTLKKYRNIKEEERKMYTDPGIWSLIIAAVVGVGLTPIYFFREKIKSLFKRKKE